MLRSVAVVLLSVVVSEAAVAVDRVNPQPPAPEYQFTPDASKPVAMLQDGKVVDGRLDAHGNFHPLPKEQQHPGLRISGPPVVNSGTDKVYEYRSGMLIAGKLDGKGSFVPELGSTITDFKSYHYRPDGMRIYNLPGYFDKKTPGDRK